MKLRHFYFPAAIIIIALLSTFVSDLAFFDQFKDHQYNERSKAFHSMRNVLTDMKRSYPSFKVLKVRDLHPKDELNYSSYFFATHILAPRTVCILEDEASSRSVEDTVLLIYKKPDVTMIEAEYNIIWQTNDNYNHYALGVFRKK